MIKMNTSQLEPFIWIDFNLTNFSDFREVVHSWEIDFLQLDGGDFHAVLQQVVFPEIQIAHTSFDCHMDQKGFSPKDMWTFVLMSETSSMIKFQHEITKSQNTMLIYSPGMEINAVTTEGFDVYLFTVHKEYLQTITKKLGFDDIENRLSKIDRIELEEKQVDSLRTLLKGIMNTASKLESKVITAEGKSLIYNFLPMKFLKEIGTKIGCAKEKTFQDKDMLFKELRSYIHTHLEELLNIAQLSSKFNISERSLRNYFHEEFDTSPKKYLTSLRLSKVRDELKVLNKKKGVVEKTARTFGFQHMGQFSKNYKEYFGELPSETLKESQE